MTILTFPPDKAEAQTFYFDGHDVRVVSIDGEPWFVLADLCKVLDLPQVSRVKARLDDALTQSNPIVDSFGRTQHATIVSEAGMYEVVIRSDKPEAAAFRRWITTEVLPSIRKRGGYLTPEAAEKALTDPDFIIRLATELKIEQAKRQELEALRKIEAPKAQAFDLWLSSNADYDIGSAARALAAAGCDTGRNRLFGTLRDLDWAFKASEGWRYKQQHGPQGTNRLAVRLDFWQDQSTGERHGTTTLRITTKGINDLATKLGVNPADVFAALDESEDVA